MVFRKRVAELWGRIAEDRTKTTMYRQQTKVLNPTGLLRTSQRRGGTMDSANSRRRFPKPGWQFPENGSLTARVCHPAIIQCSEQEGVMALTELLAHGLQGNGANK